MAEKITPEQWLDGQMQAVDPSGYISLEYGIVDVSLLRADESTGWSALMAVCNHALPDDDQWKITSRDVGLMRDIASGLEAADDIPGARGSGRTLHRIAAKLAALLPPEELPPEEE
jgi:hypothetical protein